MKVQNENAPTNASNGTLNIQRVKDNEQFFSSFIDLVPANVYLNPDDRTEWLKFMRNDSATNRRNKPHNELTTNGKSSDGEENDDHDSDELNTTASTIDYKINKFEPKYFKTVTQILNDFQRHDAQTAASSKKSLKINRLRLKKTLALKEKAKNTKIKVLNKSQNKSSKKAAENGTASPQANKKPETSENTNNVNSNKRLSKFKEHKNAAVKRLRQRYDSQTETQIVDVEHSEANTENAANKPILNKNGEIVYSKFDFTADKTIQDKKKKDNKKLTPINPKPKDYKKLLNKLEKEQEQLKELKEKDPAKAKELEMKNKWKAAFNKAAGVKVKDDVTLLSKSIKRMDKKKQKAKKSWDQRTKAVEERKAMAQDKRKKNLEKRKDKNRDKKIKKLKKKGRIFPGF